MDADNTDMEPPRPSQAGEFANPFLAESEPPLRLELFSEQQRRERGMAIAQEHAAAAICKPDDSLLKRLAGNSLVLKTTHRRLVDEVTDKNPITSVGEWLVDNYYVIEEQINIARRHLPKHYLAELPGIQLDDESAIPRVYNLAEQIVAFGDGRVDVADIGAVVSAYQETLPLRLGELWAIPIMLRLALIENLRRMAVRIGKCQDARAGAARWADELIRVDREDPKSLVLTVADMARAAPELNPSFVAEFKRRLQDRGAGLKMPLQWVEQNLNETGSGIEQVVSAENHIQAVLEISMRNSINSLRGLNSTDWREFVESTSLVEAALKRDPAGVYPDMDFSTRDSYRRVIGKMAKKSALSEVEVAEKCLELAAAAAKAETGSGGTNAHVGYYLIGDGEHDLKKAVKFSGTIEDAVRTASHKHTLYLYLGSILGLTIAFTAVTAWLAASKGLSGWLLFFLTVLLAFAAGHVAIGLANFIATLIVKPRALPRMNYAKGIPPEQRTLVVVPIIVGKAKSIEPMLKNLETRFLNNRGQYIHFALLTDFPDAASETVPEDGELLDLCRRGIEKLNQKYRDDGGDNFFLFHRPRKWNEKEKVWMGQERKRGKLEDLNRYLLGEAPDVFSCVSGKTESLRDVKYVITLDADTMMARESAWKLVGAMAHPLNRPVYDEKLGRVVKGHGILQPRVDSCLAGANRTGYARMSATEIGLDPYTRASSDVYQDLFDEGSFIGKGIYDVAMFNRALGGRFPDNMILSHDLLEGCVVRSGLLNDVKVYEDPPSTYMMDMLRRHRWVRGDWQIASYLMAKETRRGFKATVNPLNMLSQWKIFDNLRRSLTPLFLLLLLILGLTVLKTHWLYLLIVGCVFIIPVLINAFASLVRKSPDKTLGQHLSNMASSTLKQAVQSVFKFACLPYEAYVNTDAIVRSLWRQCVSHRHLLQWNPSDNSYRHDLARLLPLMRRMWIGPVAALAMTAVLVLENRGIVLYALPLFALWFISPLIVSWFSKPRIIRQEALTPKQSEFLRLAARRTWLFFEDFVTESDNWLPPDNYQEYPEPKIAHRTSPTNMGLALLANLTAYDFGFATQGKMLGRCGKTIDTMLGMERFRGHFYNWYDTQTLKILRPAYISSVDSGNLAAHLLILASGLRSLPNEKIVSPKLFASLRDTLELAVGEAANPGNPRILALEPLRKDVSRIVANPPCHLSDTVAAFDRLAAAASEKVDDWEANVEPKSKRWLIAFVEQCRDAIADLDAFCPWARQTKKHPDWASGFPVERVPTLAELVKWPDQPSTPPPATGANGSAAGHGDLDAELAGMLETASINAAKRVGAIQELVLHCSDLASMEYEFLYDDTKRLLAIGYNVDEHRRDNSFYDLLASEARLAAYLGICQHQLPQSSWFALGRLLTLAEGRPLLVSWSGSMFEYLMPLLVMPTYRDTLLDETYKAVVHAQAMYGSAKRIPWGVSESGYNVFDAANNYQYRAFGVPELGLKHSLSEDVVIAPYASALAVMVDPGLAADNLMRLADEGVQTSYGFYEAVDYTRSRLPRGNDKAVVQSYMAHHQGMSLVAYGQALLDRPMHKRFDADPLLSSGSMLLQEMVPAERALYYVSTYSPEIHPAAAPEASPMRVLNTPNSPHPEVQLLSNGKYHVMVTAAGGGYSRWKNVSLTRWREDATRDNWGTFCYIRDRETDSAWSTTYQPTLEPAKGFEAIFSEGKAEFNRRDRDFLCHTEIVVSPEDDVEVRRVRITNRSGKQKTIDITTFAEVALSAPAADDSHQAFVKLSVETEIVRQRQAILCSRRPREPEEKNPLMFHMLAVRGTEGHNVSYETDRLAFFGRGRDASNPEAVFGMRRNLTDSEGAVLDPVVAIRTGATVNPGENVVIDIITGASESRAGAELLMEKYQDHRMADKAFDMAWMHGQLLLRQLNASETEAQTYSRLAGSIVYVNPALRAEPSIIAQNRRGQSGLWGYSISGDLPIVLLRMEDPSRLHLVTQLVKAHSYWRQKGLAVDLVIWNEDQSGYRQSLHDQIMGIAGSAMGDSNLEKPGGIFIRSMDRVAEEDRTLIQSAARVVLSDGDGMLEEQLHHQSRAEITSSTTVVQYRQPDAGKRNGARLPAGELRFDNSYGGFSEDGTEYVVRSTERRVSPLPWVNVIANRNFGTVVSEAGSSYTWAENAHEFRLTPWHNDPVSDGSGEALYIRDEQTGDYWSPTPLPRPDGGDYVTRHGFGYTAFEHTGHGIASELTVFVDDEAPVKFMVLKLRNDSDKQRSLSATGYFEWVLGDLRPKTAMHIVTSVDHGTGVLLARNQYSDDFKGRTAFLDVDDPGRTLTGDRRDFLGRNGSPARPFAMQRTNLSGKAGAGLDPCGAMQVKLTLAPGRERTVVFRLGLGHSADEARGLAHKFRGADAAFASFERVRQFWKRVLGAVQVDTPDDAFNLMANGWLLYQTLSCRFWGRSATYQSGGAFGFRDQLQDSMALLYSEPSLVREHLLRSARHQFVEGDALHWWHPPMGRGVRTRCSDDYLWLPFVAEKYVSVTGDESVLDEECSFLTGRTLREGEESYYDLFAKAEEKASLYEHCRRSIMNGLRLGRRGLPLIGSGDWNDGMDRVGREGRGESVWLGFFLYTTLRSFAAIAEKRRDENLVAKCLVESEKLRMNIEKNTWDGSWYQRAYFDDGTPLGSKESPECKIDSIAQSWAAISGAGEESRVATAMASLDRHLVDREHKLVRLFAPPFVDSALNPGYIKGYVPGVRENGGQYTHAAIWAAMGFAAICDREKTWELFSLINPVNHALTRKDADVYKVEPYVVAADVYTAKGHEGRGGWSWYTGSASWLYRFMLESILGFNIENDTLRLTPRVPAQWPRFGLRYRHGKAWYAIEARPAAEGEEPFVALDGVKSEDGSVTLARDGGEHRIEVVY